MEGKLKYLILAMIAFLTFPVTTIYQQNIEVWAEARGFDSILTRGAQVLGANPWGLPLLVLLLLSIGAAMGLWAEYWIRRKWPTMPKPSTERVETKKFRHERVRIDGKHFYDCDFDGVTLVLNGTAVYGFEKCRFGEISVEIADPKMALTLGLVELARQSGRPIEIGGLATAPDTPSTPLN